MTVYIQLVFSFCAVCVLGTAICAVAQSPPPAVSATTVRITEVMYNAEGADEGKEYVEIINTGPGVIDAKTLIFFEHNRKHAVRSVRGEPILQPGDIAIIVSRAEQFVEHYDFNGTILDTTNFALNNTGSTLAIQHQDRMTHTVDYAKENGADGNGFALHISGNGTVTPAQPSIGTVRGVPVDNSVPEIMSQEQGAEERASQQETAESSPGVRLVTEPEHVFLASESVFFAEKDTDGKKEVLYGVWNFGDGTRIYGKKVKHAYLHSGTYIISFQEVATGSERDRTNAPPGVMIRRDITIRAPEVWAERVSDVFVRLHNNHSFVLDVSGWLLFTENTRFIFPKGSLIPGQGSTVVSFSTDASAPIFIVTAGGGQFNAMKSARTDTAQPVSRKNPTEESVKKSMNVQKTETNVPNLLPLQHTEQTVKDVGVTDANSHTVQDQTKTKQMLIVWIALFFGIIAIALAPFFLSQSEKQKEENRKFKKKRKN